MSTWRLVSGIISIVLCLIVLLQSCAAGVINTVENTGLSSGTAGFIVSLLLLAAGILSIAVRGEYERSSSTALSILYGIGAAIGFLFAGNYTDLIFWALWCLICAILAYGGYALARVDAIPDDEIETTRQTEPPKKRRPILTAIRWTLTVIGGLFVLMVIIAMFSGNPEGTPDLAGRWKQVNISSGSGFQAAVIAEDTIEVYWVDTESQTQSLYWAGTFKAPTTPDQPYSWVSQGDKSKMQYALLASNADTKIFTYQDGQISYQVSMLGVTKTARLEKTS